MVRYAEDKKVSGLVSSSCTAPAKDSRTEERTKNETATRTQYSFSTMAYSNKSQVAGFKLGEERRGSM